MGNNKKQLYFITFGTEQKVKSQVKSVLTVMIVSNKLGRTLSCFIQSFITIIEKHINHYHNKIQKIKKCRIFYISGTREFDAFPDNPAAISECYHQKEKQTLTF